MLTVHSLKIGLPTSASATDALLFSDLNGHDVIHAVAQDLANVVSDMSNIIGDLGEAPTTCIDRRQDGLFDK